MRQKLRIALAQFDFPVGAVPANARRIAALIAQARDELGADLVLFPELAISGYPPEDLLLRPAFLAACEAALQRVAAACTGITAVVDQIDPDDGDAWTNLGNTIPADGEEVVTIDGMPFTRQDCFERAQEASD